MATSTILVIDDEPAVREMLRFILQQNGYRVIEAADAIQAETPIANHHPSLILLDWMLPGISGIEFARKLKGTAATQNTPIIMLTARGEEDDKVRGLESGADDYITKPFSTRELLARIKAALRRSTTQQNTEEVVVNALRLDPATHRVLAGGEEIDLGPTEFRLLHFFITHLERVYSRTQILDRVWGANAFIEERTVDVHIRRLRKALETSNCHEMLQTVRGSGYRFSAKI